MRAVLGLIYMIIAVLFATVTHAETICIVGGKIDGCGAGEQALMKDPAAIVYKIQANRVSYNMKTGNLKKADDVSPEQLKKVFSGL